MSPIFAFDMLATARRRRYYAVRAVYAMILLFVFWSSFPHSYLRYGHELTVQQMADFSAGLFSTFSVIQILVVLLIGPAVAAGTIAVERERRTIEYLFATDLTNREIVLGKLASRLVLLAATVLAGLPVLAIIGIMGGIAPDQLVMVFVITTSTAVTVSVLGISISVATPRARDAMLRTYLCLLAALCLPLVAMELLSWNNSSYSALAWTVQTLVEANPFYTLFTSISGTPSWIGGPWGAVGALVRNQMAFSAVVLAWAVWSVRRVHLRAAGRGERKRRWEIRLLPRRPIGDAPMIWKELYSRTVRTRLGIIGHLAVAVILLAAMIPVVYWFIESVSTASAYRPAEIFVGQSTAIAVLLECGALLLLAVRASSSIAGEKEKDTWTSLVSTPLEPRDIVLAKLFGNLRSVAGVAICLAVIWILQIVRMPECLLGVVGNVLALAVLAMFTSALGTRFSLGSKNSARAMGLTLVTGLFVGGLYLIVLFPIFFVARSELIILFAPMMPFLLGAPMILCVEPGSSRETPQILAAVMIGFGGYAVAAWLLCMSAIHSFDRLCERPTGFESWRGEGRPRSPVIATLTPEVAAERKVDGAMSLPEFEGMPAPDSGGHLPPAN